MMHWPRSFVGEPLLAAISFCSLCLVASHAVAAPEAEAEVDPLALQIHGFASQGYFLTTKSNYLAESKRGSFELTEVGVNITKPLTQELRFGLQLFARDLGKLGNYSVKADWFYADYRFRDWLGIRVGRVKLPFGLYNEVNDIDAARVPILLPQSVYPVASRDFLLAQTGVELYGHLDFAREGGLDYRLYGGTIFLEAEPNNALPYRISDLNVPYVVGGRLLYDTPLDGLRVGGSLQALRLDANLQFDPAAWMPLQTAGQLPATFRGKVKVEIPAVLWIASVEYAAHDVLVAFEYSRWDVPVESTTPALFPENETMSERLYGLLSYRFTSWFQPAFYYAQYYPDVKHRDGRAAKQRDWALTLRFDVNEHWLIKLEGHLMDGTAALSPALNDDIPRDRLTRRWTLFLAKTTAYF